jgi:hypothetical protein
MKSKAIFVYTVLAVFLISTLLADSHDGFMLLSMISMGFFWGFMANEKFFRE